MFRHGSTQRIYIYIYAHALSAPTVNCFRPLSFPGGEITRRRTDFNFHSRTYIAKQSEKYVTRTGGTFIAVYEIYGKRELLKHILYYIIVKNEAPLVPNAVCYEKRRV